MGNKEKNYSPNGTAILEMACSAILLIAVFLPWIRMEAFDEAKEFSLTGMGRTPIAYIWGSVFALNIVLKFFKRSHWFSFIVAIIAILLHTEMGAETIQPGPPIHYSPAIGEQTVFMTGLVLMAITVFSWTASKWDTIVQAYKRKRYLHVYLSCLGLFFMCFLTLLLIGIAITGNSDKFMDDQNNPLNTVAIAFLIIGMLIFTCWGVAGIIVWLIRKMRGKQSDSSKVINLEEDEDEVIDKQSQTNTVLSQDKQTDDTKGQILSDTANEDSLETNETDETDGSNRRKLFYYGGAAAMALVGLLALLLPNNCSGKKELLTINTPQWEMFVMVTAEDAPLYKEASTESPRLMEAIENIESDMCDIQFRWSDQGKKRGYTVRNYVLQRMEVLPVLEETDEWLKVHIESYLGNQTEAYIQKRWCQEIKPSPITDEVLTRMTKNSWRCDNIIRSGNLKGLCFTTKSSEMEDETLSMGILNDGRLLYPEHYPVLCVRSMDEDVKFEETDEWGHHAYKLTYGPQQTYKVDGKENYVFDTHLLSDEEAERIYNAIKKDNPSFTTVVYYFPEVNADRLFTFTSMKTAQTPANTEDDRVQEGLKNFTIVETDGQRKLMAELDEEQVFAGVENDLLDVIHEEDFDGDGYNEAVISESCGGSGCIPEIYVVYYDKDVKEFKQTNRSELCTDPAIEKWEGKTTLVQHFGIRKDTYIYDDHNLKLVNKEIAHVSKPLKRWACNELFASGTFEPQSVRADIDGDGIDEILVFGHNDSMASDYGKDMFLDRIQWADGHVTDEYIGIFSSSSFAILETSQNGMHDLLLEDARLLRWNGSQYEEYQWDGSQFIKLPTY